MLDADQVCVCVCVCVCVEGGREGGLKMRLYSGTSYVYHHLTKTKRNRKWKIPQIFLKRRTLCFSPHKNCKCKTASVGACERKKEGIFFISICSVLLLHIKKHFFIFFCLFLKSSTTLSVFLKVSMLTRDLASAIKKFRFRVN